MKKGLGKGLGALIPGYDESISQSMGLQDAPSITEQRSVLELKVVDIEPNRDQPRKSFDEKQLQSLADSIKQYGLIQPIIVSKMPSGRYQIIAGERRWRASRLAGLDKIPVVISDVDGSEIMEVALIENLQREDLNPIEEALGYKVLVDEYRLTQEQISEKIGKSRPAIANALRLLTLGDEIKLMVVSGLLTSGHARCLVGLDDQITQLKVANRIIDENLTVRETEELIKKADIKPNIVKPKKTLGKDIYVKDLENRMSKMLGYKVSLTEGSKKNKLEIEYYDNEDLDKIMKIMGVEK